MTKAASTSVSALGLDSYRGRYFWLSLLTALLLAGLAWWGRQQVLQVGERATALATRHTEAIGTVIDAEQTAHRLKEHLLAFSLDPDQAQPEALDTGLRRLSLALDRLAARPGAVPGGRDDILDALRRDVATLDQAIGELVRVRLQTDAWVPASRVMRARMVPATDRMAGILQQLYLLLDDREQAAARERILRIRLDWQHVIGELRLLVANRFGVFDTDPERGMASRVTNIEGRLELLERELLNLPRLLAEAGEPLAIDDADALLDAFNEWTAGYRQLRVLLDDRHWRQDLALLERRITPVLDRLLQRLESMRVLLQSASRAQLDQLLALGRALASSIGWLAVGIVALLGAGYLAFQHWLLRPIGEIAEQLHREARGESGEELRLPPIHETRHLVEAFSAMREQVRARERRLDHLAYHDALTGLPNRRLFHERLEDALHNELARGRHVAVLFVDLDHFKQINDQHGHRVGDELLVQVARRLRRTFRADDLVARLSGDEFAVLLGRFRGDSEPARLARKVIDVLGEPFEVEGLQLHASASVGISIAPEHGTTADRLVQHADTAMYQAKAAGRAGVARFRHDMLEQARPGQALERALHEALRDGQFRIHVQPIVDREGRETRALECLLRWAHPERGLLAPDAFLATAEEMGLMPRITEWMLDRIEAAGGDLPHAINVSARLLQDPAFLDGLGRRILSGRLRADRLILEITEDTLARDLERITLQLADVQALGVRIALDDFGTGQSSLSHLRAFPFDLLKIDRSFVADAESDEQDARLVRAIIRLAQTLGIEVVGEGVETQAQHDFLRAEGCDLLQGFRFGRPRPMETEADEAAPA